MAPSPAKAPIPVLNGWSDFQFGDRIQTQMAVVEDEEAAQGAGEGWPGQAPEGARSPLL